MPFFNNHLLSFLGVLSISHLANGGPLFSVGVCLPRLFPEMPDLVEEHESHGRYVTLTDGTEMFVRDEDGGGGENAETIVLMHGVPTSSLLYSEMIPLLVNKGHRVVALDLPGLGLSEKPINRNYTFDGLKDSVVDLLTVQLNLTNINLVYHDLGGAIGNYFLIENYDRVSTVTIMDTPFREISIPFPMSGLLLPVLGEVGAFTFFASPCMFWAAMTGFPGFFDKLDSFTIREAEAWAFK